MKHKELAKIQSIKFGFGGYQDVQFGVWISFAMPGAGVGTGKGFWADDPSPNAQWTVESREKFFGALVMELSKWCTQAKVKTIDELKDKPVELTFEREFGQLESWRILTEVI